MKNKGNFIILIFLLSFFFFLPKTIASPKKAKDLPERYRKWLQEEVVYIITPREKEVFLKLKNDKERDMFIEAFWKQRDPYPNTPQNEFKKEHYRRLNYANKMFGRGTPTAGWRTEKGRIYIILGEPNQIEKYENETEIIPTEIWFYQGKVDFGLPNSFNVVFIQREGFGDWELYSPIKDGPKTFLRFYHGDPANTMAAYQQLSKIQPNVAQVSISLIPQDQLSLTAPSIASDVLISRIFETPKKIDDQYAAKLLKYKDIIEVEYTANYIGNDSLTYVIQDKSGLFFVHYLLEPKRLSVERAEGTYYTTLEISGQVTDSNGKRIFQFNKKLPVKFDQRRFEQIKTKLFSYQDAFPLIEGNYTFHLLLKNVVSKEFTSFERTIFVPKSSGFQMSPLLIAPLIKESPYQSQIKAFRVGKYQIYPSPRNDFSQNDKLTVFFELYGLPEEIERTGKIGLTIYKDDQEVWTHSKDLKEYRQKKQFLESIPLKKFPPAYYRLKASILNKEDREILFEQAFFFISARETVPRPFIYTELMAPPEDPVYDYILGGEFFNKGQIQKAKTYLEEAYNKKPQNLKYAIGFSRVLFTSQQYQPVIDTLSPFVQGEKIEYSCFNLLGRSYQALGKYVQATDCYKKYLAHFGTNLKILNALGECYFQSGNKKEALVVWKKSLEIDSNQKEIKERVRSLERKNDEKY